MLTFSKGKLLTRIEEKKSELLRIAAQNGINSEQTIQCSQELDNLVLAYQKRFSTHQQKEGCSRISDNSLMEIMALL